MPFYIEKVLGLTLFLLFYALWLNLPYHPNCGLEISAVEVSTFFFFLVFPSIPP